MDKKQTLINKNEKAFFLSGLEDIQNQMETSEVTNSLLWQEKEVSRNLQTILHKEEEEAYLKSRCLWLKAGDQNTKYFHNQCKEGNRKNTIKDIIYEKGVQISGSEEIKTEIKNHFEDIYTKEEEDAQEEELKNLSEEIPNLLQ